MSKQLYEALHTFMDVADDAYQSNKYINLNKAFQYLNPLYERLHDEQHITDIDELVDDVMKSRKIKSLNKILDDIEIHKKNIKTSTNNDCIIEDQKMIIKLLESYILIDNDLA
mgnify:CR=1 FL=1|tara:strand:+ start:409 stop:747 length:339 start_codon:yes stop_codon:yes gene_type:complete